MVPFTPQAALNTSLSHLCLKIEENPGTQILHRVLEALWLSRPLPLFFRPRPVSEQDETDKQPDDCSHPLWDIFFNKPEPQEIDANKSYHPPENPISPSQSG
jgi:hypothetical protein